MHVQKCVPVGVHVGCIKEVEVLCRPAGLQRTSTSIILEPTENCSLQEDIVHVCVWYCTMCMYMSVHPSVIWQIIEGFGEKRTDTAVDSAEVQQLRIQLQERDRQLEKLEVRWLYCRQPLLH